ncbi:MAG: SUMF1/EgtB/PvdO family nonheme iron enzyme [Chloroflexi bacterium]|nr:SUMF1/EgtB/PvdO family nonheme iron enzyme [Chloroflexota bacterium]
MDSLIPDLALAIQAATPFILQKLVEKGLIEPAVKPLANKVQARATKGEKDAALEQAILAAIKDVAPRKSDSQAVAYARKIRLHEIVEPGNEALRDEMMRLAFLATTKSQRLVPLKLLDVLRLNHDQRPALASFLFHLHQRLNALPDYQPLLQAARDQAVIKELKAMARDLSELVGTVEETRKGKAVRVRVIADDWSAEPYLRYLANVCNVLPLRVIDPQYASPTGETATLSDVYTNLEVTTTVQVKVDKRKSREEQPQLMEREKTRRMTVLEAVSDSKSRRLVLLGDPGGGKSTFVNYLAFCLAKHQLEPKDKWLERLPAWTVGALVPVRIILRDWVAWVSANNSHQPNAQLLWDFLKHDLTSHGLENEFAPLKKHLLEHGGLVLLDGLDEVPDANARRALLKSVIEDFERGCGKCRIVVTCRPYAYEKREWKLPGFAEQTIAPFSDEQIENFIRGWYHAVVQVSGMNAALAESKANALIAACGLPHLAELAPRPLLLTLMATLHTSRGKLPDDRAELYEDCVRLLLDFWQQNKRVQIDGQTESEQGILDALSISRDRLEQVLNQIAFTAHTRQGKSANRQNVTADISGEELRKVLVPAFGDDWNKAQTAIHYVRTRAGLLIEREPDVFAFPHRTFQEFLTARFVVNSEDFPQNLAEWVCNDRAWWREVFLLAAGHARPRAFGNAVALINTLCDKPYHPGDKMEDTDAYAAALAAQAAADIHLKERATSPGRYQDTLRKLQTWLVGTLRVAQGALPLVERANAGRILSALGDPRPDVNCAIPAMVDVPAGEFVMGSDTSNQEDEKPQHRVTLNAYRIGKYPVTNAQYRRFVDDKGYTKFHRDCWTDAGWSWREKENIEKPPYLDHPEFGLDNHPVVGVSWYEALAYCNWLTKTNPGRKFRLPTEAEWERAARHTDGREYSWEGEFDPEKANTSESKIGRTTAVGSFPLGASTCGALDMSGNVWEWCSTRWGKGYENPEFKYPYQSDDGRENLQSTDIRILRGGSWVIHLVFARCAYRVSNNPHSRNLNIGFRVAESFPGLGSAS